MIKCVCVGGVVPARVSASMCEGSGAKKNCVLNHRRKFWEAGGPVSKGEGWPERMSRAVTQQLSQL